MVTTLRVIVDAVLDPASRSAAHYAENLTRALILTAPRGCVVEGIVSALTEPEYAELDERLPGLAGLAKSSLARRELRAAWQHGITPFPSGGLIHAPTLLAPLRRHERTGAAANQIVVTVHDAIALTDPELTSDRRAGWHLGMIKRAERYADAVVVPTHAVADVLRERTSLGDRVRVIAGGVAPTLLEPKDAADRRAALELPDRYVLTLATLNPRKGLDDLLAAVARLDVPLAVVGDPTWQGRSIEEARDAAGVPENRLLVLGPVSDADLAAAYSGAAALVHPGRAEGFGLPVLEAFALGIPVVISDDPALVEIAADAAEVVPLGDHFADGLAEAIRKILNDREVADRLSVAGADRVRAFTWRDAAEKTWQLHADL